MIVSSFITVSSAKIETSNTILNTIKVNENTNSPPVISSIEYCGTIKYDKDLDEYLCQWKVYFNDPDGDYCTLFFKTNYSSNWDYQPHNAHLVDHFFFSWWIELGTYTAYFYVEDVIGLKSDTISYTYDVTKTKSINQNIDDNIGLIKPHQIYIFFGKIDFLNITEEENYFSMEFTGYKNTIITIENLHPWTWSWYLGIEKYVSVVHYSITINGDYRTRGIFNENFLCGYIIVCYD
jgi:hypothetical protein